MFNTIHLQYMCAGWIIYKFQYAEIQDETTPNSITYTDRNFVDNFLQVEIYLALVANI